uniref:Putative transposase n=1 Tax=uncultured bacterium 5G12 TaxID=1701325 RepID=A0A166H224_9BACT|nr:putative transposase [uncultured bacterium 5G12]
MNLPQLIERFGSEDKCRAYLEDLRWPDGVECPRCQSKKISRIEDRKQYECSDCRYQFSVTAGTIMHDSHLPLWKWFLAIYLVTESKKGISAKQLQRTLGGSYKTAWYLQHRIRDAMGDDDERPLSGIIEADETWHGGKRSGHGSGPYAGRNKTVIVGAVERGGEIRLRVTRGRDRGTIERFLGDVVSDDAKAIMTDEWIAYDNLGDHNTMHHTVNHTRKEYVRGDVHTNTVENVWSLFKRSVVGSYHQVSVKHLPAYLDELEWRFNNRDNPYLFRDTMLRIVNADTLGYDELIKP